MSFTPLIFDPTQVDLYESDPDHPRSIQAHIAAGDATTGFHRKRDFRVFLSPEEIEHIRDCSPLSVEEVSHVALQLMEHALSVIEGFDKEVAARVVELIVKQQQIEDTIARVYFEEPDDVKRVLTVASELYDLIDTELYIHSMRLNLEDFQSVFPVKFCLHDPAMVLKRLEDPGYQVSDVERTLHLKNNRSMSFGILACMSMYDVRENTIDPDMRILLNAGRYQTLKAVFDAAAETEEADPKLSGTLKPGDGDEVVGKHDPVRQAH